MIKLKHAIIGVLISNACIAYYCNSIMDDLRNEITHLNELLTDTGVRAASGTYVVQMLEGGERHTQKLTLLQ